MGSGVDVQVYADPVIAEMLNYTFKQLFEKRFWSFNRKETVHTLGVNGLVTDSLVDKIKSYTDLRYVFLETAIGTPSINNKPLPEAPGNINPSSIYLTSIRQYSDPTKVFQVLPVTTTGFVRLVYRTNTQPFVDSDEVPMDDHLMILAAAYEFLSDEGTNTVAVKRLEDQMKARLSVLEKAELEKEKSLYSYTMGGLDSWRDTDA
jgi:hypothetical protein